MVRRVMPAKRLAVDAALGIVMGVAVVIVVIVAVNLRRPLPRYGAGGCLRGRTMGQNDNKRCHDQRKNGCQHDHVACCYARSCLDPAMMARLIAHTLPSLQVALSP